MHIKKGIQHSWSYIDQTDAFQRSLKLASLVGCPTRGKDRSDVIKCLTEKPADEIANKEVGVAPQNLNYSPFVITKDYNNFMPESPRDWMLKQMEQNREGVANVDYGSILIGSNDNEGSKPLMYYLPRMFPNHELESKVLKKELFEEAIEKLFSNAKEVGV